MLVRVKVRLSRLAILTRAVPSPNHVSRLNIVVRVFDQLVQRLLPPCVQRLERFGAGDCFAAQRKQPIRIPRRHPVNVRLCHRLAVRHSPAHDPVKAFVAPRARKIVCHAVGVGQFTTHILHIARLPAVQPHQTALPRAVDHAPADVQRGAQRPCACLQPSPDRLGNQHAGIVHHLSHQPRA